MAPFDAPRTIDRHAPGQRRLGQNETLFGLPVAVSFQKRASFRPGQGGAAPQCLHRRRQEQRQIVNRIAQGRALPVDQHRPLSRHDDVAWHRIAVEKPLRPLGLIQGVRSARRKIARHCELSQNPVAVGKHRFRPRLHLAQLAGWRNAVQPRQQDAHLGRFSGPGRSRTGPIDQARPQHRVDHRLKLWGDARVAKRLKCRAFRTRQVGKHRCPAPGQRQFADQRRLTAPDAPDQIGPPAPQPDQPAGRVDQARPHQAGLHGLFG